MIGVGIYLKSIFEQQRYMMPGFHYKKHTDFIIYSGVSLAIFHLIGSKICYDSGNYRTRSRFHSFMSGYMFLLLVAFALQMAVSISANSAVLSLKKGFPKGFLNAMASYESDPNKRRQVDQMQITHKCCGSSGYKDWLEISWYPEQFIRPELKDVNGRAVPFTCCDPSYRGPCLHDAASQNTRPGYLNDNEKGFFKKGCSHVMTHSLKKLLNNLSLWILLPMFMELVILVLVKYLHTSGVNADEDGTGFGYLMEACPCTCCECCEIDIHSIKKKPLKP
ncbi:hypothetical protein JTE90_014111 [Oedothorax gibbosus]|uniref:Tetraspanin n=1 Tax=Oedothorax gibbosus TaxID=931172 RepID=A0AAV6V6C1_9ARAC|nr:hypothetical protein JTE90_014111 [Oedothorax gibbosus]